MADSFGCPLFFLLTDCAESGTLNLKGTALAAPVFALSNGGRRRLKAQDAAHLGKTGKAAENLKKSFQKGLLFRDLPAIITKRDCDRYAMKREVAADTAGFSVEYVRF